MNGILTSQQQLFCDEYLIDLNATQAAIRAGYSARAAHVQGVRLLRIAKVHEYIAARKRERSADLKIDAAYVLRQAVKIHERCMQEISPKVDRKGEPIKDADGHPLYVFDANGATRALELIGKHIDVGAFEDKIRHSGETGVTIDVSRMSEAEREALAIIARKSIET